MAPRTLLCEFGDRNLLIEKKLHKLETNMLSVTCYVEQSRGYQGASYDLDSIQNDPKSIFTALPEAHSFSRPNTLMASLPCKLILRRTG